MPTAAYTTPRLHGTQLRTKVERTHNSQLLVSHGVYLLCQMHLLGLEVAAVFLRYSC